MVKETIKIHLRLRPSNRKKTVAKYVIESNDEGKSNICIESLREVNNVGTQHRKEFHRFQFDQVFDVQSRQDQVFDVVSKPVIEKALAGYNGTIFAYGQTGSGKTFTITGGAEKYSDRGIIPRAIAYIFDQFEKNLGTEFTLRISYMEIYNEVGYDLLDSRHNRNVKLEDFPRVTIYEHNDAGTVHLKNLSIHPAMDIDGALNLLFMGDTNRMIAETPMNEASTRSHCIFTMHITARDEETHRIRRSKLHLVDLAGSERVYKFGLNGTTLTEAKYINLSLHYLEQVIVALADKQRTHIPYRNSMMTMVLRDSLGGNCMTSMIATCSIEETNLLETLSTCRFSQRVALIKNDILINEDLDPQTLITNLKQEIQRLKSELVLTTGHDRDEELSLEAKEQCENLIRNLMQSDLTDQLELPSEILSDARMIIYGFECARKLHHTTLNKLELTQKTSLESSHSKVPPLPMTTKEADELREVLSQRDHEIRILVTLLKREKSKREQLSKQIQSTPHGSPIQSQFEAKSGTYRLTAGPDVADHVTNWLEQQAKQNLLGSLSMGREEAFNLFKQDYIRHNQIESQKDQLKFLYAEARSLGSQMKQAKEDAGHLQAHLNSLMQTRSTSSSITVSESQISDKLEQLRSDLEFKNAEYRRAYEALKELKPQVEHLQHNLETAKLRLVQDFQVWWAEQSEKQHNGMKKLKLQAPDTSLNLSEQDSMKPVTPQQQLHSEHDMSDYPSQSLIRPKSPRHDTPIGCEIPLTGDPLVDADILTFIRAREKIRRRQVEQRKLKKVG